MRPSLNRHRTEASGTIWPAVERELSIVGEAVNQAIKLEPALEQVISGSKRIIDFRKILIY